LGWCPKWFKIRALVPSIIFVPCFYGGIKKIEKYRVDKLLILPIINGIYIIVIIYTLP